MKKRTRRVLLAIVVFVIAVIAVPVGFVISAFASNTPIPDGLDLTPTARLIKDGFVDVTMIDLENGTVALVDAGNDKQGKAILAELERRKLPPEAVAAIFLTHGHGDHLAGAHLFPRAEIYALKAEVPLIEGRAHPAGALGSLMPLNKGLHVAHPLSDGEIVTLGNRRVQVFAVPGHTAGSAVYLIDGVLYFGDSAMAHTDGKVHPAVTLFSENPELNHASLKALAERLRPQAATIKTLVFAHTGPMQGLQPLLDCASTL